MTAHAPRPTGRGIVHLARWSFAPLPLLEEGARLGPVFEVALWRRTVIGWTPEWNRAVLGDLEIFRSRGALAGLTPYLNGGIVQTDPPEHRPRRRELNKGFSRPAIGQLSDLVRDAVERHIPPGASGSAEAVQWSGEITRAVLAAALLGDRVGPEDAALLAAFLRPLDQPLPIPFVRRPVLFSRMNRRLAAALDAPEPAPLAAVFRENGGVTEARVALAAGYDTTAHTMAWILAHVAADPSLLDEARRRFVVDEAARLYPAGWVGSRRTSTDTRVLGVDLPRGTLALYSPYLTHRASELWPEPLRFLPERFAEKPDYWAYIPFAAGQRTCLGQHFARLILNTVLDVLAEARAGAHPWHLAVDSADLRPRTGVTLFPHGPVVLRRRSGPG
jgi:cytochrome P450